MRTRRITAAMAAALTLTGLVVATAHAAPGGTPGAPRGFAVEEATVAEIHAAFADKSLTCKQLVQGYLDRIATYEPELNALITVSPDAMARARALDAEYKRTKGDVGPLHCIPVVLKDNIDTDDMPTTAGSKTLEGSVPEQDATITRRMEDAGAIVIAKGNMDEWAHGGRAGYSSMNGQTVNPYDPALSPGGSSGGPAVAVAASYGVIGVGSDTLGSIRGPVNQNGLAGIKPTMGLVSGAGVVPFALTFDVAGPLTRTVEDSARFLDAVAGPDSQDPRTVAAAGKVPGSYLDQLTPDALEGVRVGVLRSAVSDADTALMDQAVTDLEALGADVVDGIQAPASMRAISGQYYTFVSETEFKTQLGQYLTSRRPDAAVQSHADVLAASEAPGFPIASQVLTRLRSEATRGSMTDPAYLQAATEGPAAMRAGIDALLEQHDVDVLLHSAGSGSDMASLSGYPEAMVPMGTLPDGAPRSLALLGPAFSEPSLLGYAYAYEQATLHRTAPDSTPPLDAPPAAGH